MGRFKWILWRGNFNNTIINGIMIEYLHDRQNHRAGFGKRDPVFEVKLCMFDIPIYWCISCLITVKGTELFNLSSDSWWEKVRSTHDSGIVLVSNSTAAFANNHLSILESFNNRLYIILFVEDEVTKLSERLPK